MNKLRVIFGLAWSMGGLGLAGCETIVDVDTPPHTPRLALSYTLSNMPPEVSTNDNNRPFFAGRKLFVSSSQGVLETKEPNGRGDATVQLLDENELVVEQFRSVPEVYRYNYDGVERTKTKYGNYEAEWGFAGEPGHRYTLRASAPGIAPVESSLVLPAVPAIELAGYVAKPREPNSGGYGDSNYNGRLTVAITDNPATTDYYLAYARILDKQGNYWGSVSPDYSASGNDGPDIDLGLFRLSQPNGYYSQYPYSDASNSGSRLSFSTDVRLYFQGTYNNGGGFPEPGYIEIIVSNITADAYQFNQSVLRYYDTDGNIFAEPAPLYSNLRGGYGLFGGSTDAVYRIKIF